MKVLVTGATGFLGRAVVRELGTAGHELRVLVRNEHALETWPEGEYSVEPCLGELSDPGSLERCVAGVDAVVHAAARVSTTGTWEEFASANVRGTMHLIDLARAAEVGRFVHISSLSVFALPQDGAIVSDTSAYESEAEARGHYSRSKLAADRLALWQARQGAPVIVLRPGLLWGPGRRPPLARQSVTWRKWRVLLARKDYPLPLSHVQSVARAVRGALEATSGAVGRAFNVVDVHVPQRLWVDAYRELAGESWFPVYLPVRFAVLAAGGAEKALKLARRRSPVTRHQVARATYRAWYDCSAAEQWLGWTPRTDWRSDLREVLDSLKSASAA